MKAVYAVYVLAIAVAGAVMYLIREYATGPPTWLYLLPLVLLIPPINMHIRRRLISLRFHDDHLTLETGLFSRTRRTVDTAKIQDVTVQQSFGQRVIGVGNLIFQDAGESGGMAIQNLDRPRHVADSIIASSKKTRR